MARSTLTAYLALALGVLFMGFSGIFVRWANAPGIVTGFYRMAIATALMTLPFWRNQSRQRRRGARPWTRREVALAALGGLFFAGDLTFWNSGIMISGATNPTLLGNTAPVWVGLGAYFIFHEQLGRRFWYGLTLALAGALLILGLDALRSLTLGLGSLYGLIAGVFYGAYFLTIQRSRSTMDTVTVFWLVALSATLALGLFTIIGGLPFTGYPPRTYLSFLGLGLVVHGAGQFLFSYALGYLPASHVSPAGLGQPVVTAILAVPLLGEQLSAGQIVGGLIVLFGVYLVQRSRPRPAPPPPLPIPQITDPVV